MVKQNTTQDFFFTIYTFKKKQLSTTNNYTDQKQIKNN